MMKSLMLLMKPGKSGAIDVPILRNPFSTVACRKHGQGHASAYFHLHAGPYVPAMPLHYHAALYYQCVRASHRRTVMK